MKRSKSDCEAEFENIFLAPLDLLRRSFSRIFFWYFSYFRPCIVWCKCFKWKAGGKVSRKIFFGASRETFSYKKSVSWSSCDLEDRKENFVLWEKGKKKQKSKGEKKCYAISFPHKNPSRVNPKVLTRMWTIVEKVKLNGEQCAAPRALHSLFIVRFDHLEIH